MWNRLGYLSQQSVSGLNKYFESKKADLQIGRYDRVKNVRVLPRNSIAGLLTADDEDVQSAMMESYQIIDNKMLTPYTSYILEYYEGSYAKMHTDNIGDSGSESRNPDGDSLTTVTLLHKSEDLNGGNILIGGRYNGPRGAITVLDIDVGEVISYGHKDWHGVSKVLRGSRRVLINWYKLKE